MRPPIIISNGGVKDKLGVGQKLMAAIHELNNSKKATASWIKCDHDNVPMIIWHLKNEDKDVLNTLLKNMYRNKNATVGDEIKK